MRFLALLLVLGLGVTTYAQVIFRKGPSEKVFESDTAFVNDYLRDSSAALAFHPIFQFGIGTQSEAKLFNSNVAGGSLSLNRKGWSLEAYAVGTYEMLTPFQAKRTEQFSVLPGFGKASVKGNYWANLNVGGVVNYTPNKYFKLAAGYDRQFIGEGYRSVLLSDNSSNAPFFKASAQFWKIQYSTLFMALDNNQPANEKGFKTNKYTATHALNYNATKWLSLQLFESVVWQAKDSLVSRGFDVNYLNPLVFYRPVEFNLGSADNVLLGMGIRLKPIKRLTLYSQFLLDEFLLREIKAQNGWWANKFSIQLGAKYFDAFGLKGLNLLSELNIVRPFTYSHVSQGTAYTNFYQPLAHPLGSNFYEFVAIAQYTKGKHQFNAKGILYKKGENTTRNFGADPLMSYNSRAMNYGNKIGQGNASTLFYSEFNYYYLVNAAFDAKLFASLVYRSDEQAKYSLVILGFKTSLFNSYRDY